jgi:class 3 adenylate cyclase
MDVGEWLRTLGLEQYEPAFRANEIDERILASLTAEDLKDLGVTLVGHRRRLLDAIALLGIEAGLHPSLPIATIGGSSLPNPPLPAGEGRVGVEAERRQLTVMFCDLVGSTALSARLDPEDLREVIGAYHRAVAEIVAGFDGFVAKYMGDGVLVYFGYPRAHEDDAERAVRAGLGLIDVIGRLDVAFDKLQARVGIATGLVVVGDLIGEGSAQEQSVVGETPNLAGRLQALAEPDAVVIAASTRRLVGDLFEVRDLGAVEVKGIAGPVPAWQVLRPSVVASRFEALRGSALTRLVGRDEEIDLLLRRWARAKAGDGQVVLVSGEPGLGKSRITAALEERLHAEPYLRLRYFCSPYHQDSALYPFVDQLGRASRVRTRRPARFPAAETRSLAGPRRAAGGGCGIPRRSAVTAGFGAPPAAEPQSAAEEGADIGGADPPARRFGAPATGGHGFRGRALDRSDLARAARSHRRAGAQLAVTADRDLPPRIPTALDRPAAGDDAGAQSPGPARPDRFGNADR